MYEIFVAQHKDNFVALLQGRVIANGPTQDDAAQKAHAKYPSDKILVKRGRDTNSSRRNEWREWRLAYVPYTPSRRNAGRFFEDESDLWRAVSR